MSLFSGLHPLQPQTAAPFPCTPFLSRSEDLFSPVSGFFSPLLLYSFGVKLTLVLDVKSDVLGLR